MTDIIFGKEASRYWLKGISVVPLRVKQKIPFFLDWSKWQNQLPMAETQAQWIDQFPYNNIGLVLGPQSNLTAVDVDSEDPRVQEAILKVLPHSPWVRVGRKGSIMLYKWNGTGTKRILDENRKTVVEILSAGSQFVLPPSIHPDTGLPYTANCDLLDVYDQIPMLPPDIEQQLRDAVSPFVKLYSNESKFKLSEKVSFGGRDISMTKHAGAAATMIIRGEVSLLRAMDNMRVWYDQNVEKKEGDQLDIEKGLRMIVQFLINDVNVKGVVLPKGWDDGMTEEQKRDWGVKFDADQEEWSVEQIVEYIFNEFQQYAEGNPKRFECAEFILKKISKSINLTVLEVERILQVLKEGTKQKVSTLQKRLNEISAGALAGVNHTEIAQAAISEFERKGYILRHYSEGFWTWNGTHWIEMDVDEIWSFIAREFGELPAATKANDHNGIIKIMGKLLPKRIKMIELAGINFKNGFLTKDMALLPHSPDYGMTYTMPYNFNLELAGKDFRFREFLEKCWGHNADCQDKIMALYEAMAVTLFGMAPSYQRAFLLHGVGGSGKSQVLDIVSHMVPVEAKAALSPDLWDDKNNKAFLNNKLLNVAGELSKDRKLPDKVFKEIVSGEEITARNMYEDPFNFRPKAAHWFAANFLPKSRDTSNGFNRRWLIFDFDRVVPEAERVVDLGKTIANEEMEAIIATALAVFVVFQKRGCYTLPESHKVYVQEMSLANSVIRQWMAQRVVQKEGLDVKEMDLYRDFWNFCATQLAARVVPQKQWYLDLMQFLAEEGISNTKTVNGEIVFTNMCLKSKTGV